MDLLLASKYIQIGESRRQNNTNHSNNANTPNSTSNNNSSIYSQHHLQPGQQHQQQSLPSHSPHQNYASGSGRGGFQNVLQQLSDQRSKIDEILLKSRNYQANKLKISLDGDDNNDNDDDEYFAGGAQANSNVDHGRQQQYSHHVITPAAHPATSPAVEDLRRKITELKSQNNNKGEGKGQQQQPQRIRTNQTLPNNNRHKSAQVETKSMCMLTSKLRNLNDYSFKSSNQNSIKKPAVNPNNQSYSYRSIDHNDDAPEETVEDKKPTQQQQMHQKFRSISTNNPESVSLPPIQKQNTLISTDFHVGQYRELLSGGSGSAMQMRTPTQTIDNEKPSRSSFVHRKTPSVGYSQKQLQWMRQVQNERSKEIQRIYIQQNPQGSQLTVAKKPSQLQHQQYAQQQQQQQQQQQHPQTQQQEQQFRDSFMNEMNAKITANKMAGMVNHAASKSKKRKSSSNNANNQPRRHSGMIPDGSYQNSNVMEIASPQIVVNGLEEFSYFNPEQQHQHQQQQQQHQSNGRVDNSGLPKFQPNPLNFIGYQNDFESLIERQSEETMEILDYVFESSKNKSKQELLQKLNEFKANFTLHAEKQDKQLREIKRKHKYFHTFDIPPGYLNFDEDDNEIDDAHQQSQQPQYIHNDG